jgi:hypothetical protein
MKFSLMASVFFALVIWNTIHAQNENNLMLRPYLEVAAGTEPGVDEAYSTLGLFTNYPTSFSICDSRLQLYNDICWQHFLKGSNGLSVEGGFSWDARDQSFGGYIGYDWRRRGGHSFDQISVGFQADWCCWAISLNLNNPLLKESIICFNVFDFEGEYRAIFKEFEATYRIVSMNISRSFCTCWPGLSGLEVVIGFEPYILMTDSKNLYGRRQKGSGGKARFLFNICGALNVEASISHDTIFHNRAQIVLGIDLLQLFCAGGASCAGSASYAGSAKGTGGLDSFEGIYYGNHTFRRQKVVASKHRESWKYNW